MYRRGLLIEGLLIVSMIGLVCGYTFAAQPSGRNEPNEPNQTTPGGRTTTQGMERTGQTPQSTGQFLRTNELIGKELTNTQGEELGTIHDIVLTSDHRRVSYIALSSGGVLGIGGKLHAIPWQTLSVGATGDITASITKEQLDAAPDFSNDNWPSQANMRSPGASATGAGQSAMDRERSAADTGQSRTDRDRSTTEYGQSATGRERSAAGSQQDTARSRSTGEYGRGAMTNQTVQSRRVTHLTGMTVKNTEGNDLGDIEEFVISASDGRVAYGVIAFGGILGLGERYAAVPLNAIQLRVATHEATLDSTVDTLKSIAFEPREFPDLSNSEYTQRLSKLFPAAPSGTTALGYVPPQSAQEQEAANERCWGADSPHAKSYNTGAVKTIEGKVQSVGMFMPQGAQAGTAGGLRLRVQTSDGKTVTVHAGPIQYAEQRNFTVMPNDTITITGSEANIQGRSVILASEIKKGDQTLQLRDESGKALWSMAGQDQSLRPGAMDREQAGQSGQTRRPGRTGQRSGQTPQQ